MDGTTLYVNEWGVESDNYDEIRELTLEQMTEDDFIDWFGEFISYDQLLEWAKKQDGFYEAFEKQIDELTEEWLRENIREYDFDDYVKCPVNDDDCPYVDHGFCTLNHPEEDCEDYILLTDEENNRE